MRVCVCECRYLWRPEGVVEALELELQKLRSCLTWVLGMELIFSGRAASVLNLSWLYTMDC